MIVISPYRNTAYVPYKKRVAKALKQMTVYLLVIMAVGIIGTIVSGKFAPGKSDWSIVGPGLGGLVILLYVVVMLSQVWVLYAVIIDEEKKKVRVQINRFDKIIDKKEYDIDDKMNIKLKKGYLIGGKAFFTLYIKYGRKTVWSQSNALFMPCWTNELFNEVKVLIDGIKQKGNPNVSIAY